MRSPKMIVVWKFIAEFISIFLWCIPFGSFLTTTKNIVLRHRESKMMVVWKFIRVFFCLVNAFGKLSNHYQKHRFKTGGVQNDGCLKVYRWIYFFCDVFLSETFRPPLKTLLYDMESKMMVVWKLFFFVGVYAFGKLSNRHQKHRFKAWRVQNDGGLKVFRWVSFFWCMPFRNF